MVRIVTFITGMAIGILLLTPDTASARGGFVGFGGFRGAAIGGWRGGAIGWRGAGLGWRGAGWGWRGGWGPGWGLGAAAVGAGLVASSYYYPYAYPQPSYGYGYGFNGYANCILQPRLVWNGWGYQQVAVQVCY